MIVAIIGGPGVGKTSLALHVAARLKESGKRAHFVGEYARSWMEKHERPPERATDQLGIIRGQKKREDEAAATHDIVIVDSTLWMCSVYASNFTTSKYTGKIDRSELITSMDCMEDALLSMDRYDLTFYVPRCFDFDPQTRVQNSVSEAELMDQKIRGFLDLFDVSSITLPTDPSLWVDTIVSAIDTHLNMNRFVHEAVCC